MKRTKKKEKALWQKARIPLPRQGGGPQSTPKGRRGYLRSEAKKDLIDLLHEELTRKKSEPEEETPEIPTRNHSPEG